ncbi:MAG TPA: peptidase [Ruminococcaceae bacterium]|nr:peptidase [Oscillospiraceae bacterium]
MFFLRFNGGNMSVKAKRLISILALVLVVGAFVLLRYLAYDVFMNIFPIVVAVLVFLLIIMVHELGHFAAAKACGIYVKQFAFGMGPALFRKQGKETEYVVRAFPVGGYCAFETDIEDFDEEKGEIVEPNPRAFNRKPVWQRMIVLVCGPLMNLILGFIVVVISLCTSEAIASTTVSEFREQSVSSSQLMVNDEILNIEGLPIYSASDITYKMQSSDRKNEAGNLVFDITVRRNGETVLLKDVEFMTTNRQDGSSGVYFDFFVYRLEKNFGNVVSMGFRESSSKARIILLTIVDIVKGKYGLNDFSGPIGVGSVITEAVKTYTFSDFMSVMAFLSINVGVFNLLPIPGLDGARLIFLIVELIRRKPVKQQVEGMIHFAGMALLLLFIIVISFNDISKLFAR